MTSSLFSHSRTCTGSMETLKSSRIAREAIRFSSDWTSGPGYGNKHKHDLVVGNTQHQEFSERILRIYIHVYI